MKTVFKSGPGFFAADSSDHDKSLPKHTMRIYCASLEAYDIEHHNSDDHDIEFDILAAKSESDPRLAKALIKPGRHIEENLETLKQLASNDD